MGNALRVGDRAGDPDGIGRAAAPLAVVGRIGPELERDREDLRPALPLAQRRDGAVDPAADGDQHPLGPSRPAGRGSARSSVATATPSARCSASAARSAAWAPTGLRPPSSAETAAASISAASRSAGAVGELRRPRPRPPGPRAQPLAGLADVGHAAPIEPQRDRDQVAAGGAAGAPAGGAGQRLAEPRVVVEIGRQGR